jgi:hypothetical protein
MYISVRVDEEFECLNATLQVRQNKSLSALQRFINEKTFVRVSCVVAHFLTEHRSTHLHSQTKFGVECTVVPERTFEVLNPIPFLMC